MPKKFAGENSKATAARAAKAAKQKGDKERIEKEKEDASWVDDDKNVLKKQQRKEEKERKEAEQRARKLELKVLADAEMEKVAGGSKQAQTAASSSGAAKVTQHQLDKRREMLDQQTKDEDDRRKLAQKKIVVVDDEDLLSENVNRLDVGVISAKTVDEALDVLKDDTTADDLDRHPEKRLRAAYTAFEERRVDALKKENPTLKLSQLKQLVKKEWQKSPDNPLNQHVLQVKAVVGKSGDASDSD